MTKEELAQQLHGNEYGQEISPTLQSQATDDGLVVVFGASDDLMEFRGAIYDEAGAWEGVTAYIVDGALWPGHACDHDSGNGCKRAEAEQERVERDGAKIEAVWAAEGYSWIYKTDIPHATFDIMEDGEKYCRGIVFSLANLKGNQ